jgi:penicillin amidase
MSKTKTVLKRTGIGLLVIIVLLGGGGGFYFKSYLPNTVAPKSFPQIDGEIQLEGLDGPVDVYRDQMGVAHIYASTSHDLFFAQGYIHAQERFWQMDFYRHVGEGRTAEMFGASRETDSSDHTAGAGLQMEYEGSGAEFESDFECICRRRERYLKDHDGETVVSEYAIRVAES